MDLIFWLVAAPVFVFGMIIGSFLNCLIWRFYCGESAARGRSYCPECRHRLSWKDLVPVASFLALRGKCRYCHKPISWQYPLVEIATAVFFVAVAQRFAPEIFSGSFSTLSLATLAAHFLLVSSLIVIFTADLRWYFIPDEAVLSGLAGAAVLIGLEFFAQYWRFHVYDISLVVSPVLSALSAAAFFLAIFLCSRGKWMGFGDVKYAFLMGLALGFPAVAVGLFFAFFFGAIMGLAMVAAQRKKLSSEIPFGPFLVAGTVVAMFFSYPIIGWYLSIGA